MNAGSDRLLERVREVTAHEYSIERELGHGGMATVYLATDLHLKRQVAIKVMSPELVEVSGLQDRFVVEARTAAHLDHPNIITVYSVKQVDNLLFIVMKYVNGRTIEDLEKKGRAVDVGVAATIVGKVAEALHYANAEGIVHRDVKPSNVMIDTRGRAIVTDFGIAKASSGAPTRIAEAGPGTIPGTLLGTAAYMSPEQCRGQTATSASDQYCLGVTAYELLAGRPPFQGGVLTLLEAHKTEAPTPLDEVVPELGGEVAETVMRMLAKDPAERWPSLRDVAARMRDHAAEHGAEPEIRERIAVLASQGAPASPAPRESFETTPSPNLDVRPSEPSVRIGETVQLRLSDPGSGSLGDSPVEWRSEDPEVATIDEEGVVTGRGLGVAKVTARMGRGVGRATVTTTAGAVDTVVATPRSPTLEVGESTQFIATALDAQGNVVSGSEIAWSSTDEQCFPIDADGRVRAGQPGEVDIVARCEGVEGRVHLKVRPAAEPTIIAPPGAAGGPVSEPDATIAAGGMQTVVAPSSVPHGDHSEPATLVREPVPSEAGSGSGWTGTDWSPGRGAMATGAGVVLAIALWALFRGGTQGPAPATEAVGPGTSASVVAGGPGGPGPTGPGPTSADGSSAIAGPTGDGAGQETPTNGAEATTVGGGVSPTPSGPDPAGTDPGPPPAVDAGDEPPATGTGDLAGADPAPSDAPAPPPEDPARATDADPTPDPVTAADTAAPDDPTPTDPPATDPDAPSPSEPVSAASPLCTDASLTGPLLTRELSSDPVARLDALYRPGDADDEEAKADLMAALRGAEGLEASATALEGRFAQGGCDWTMRVDFEWSNAFGAPRDGSLELGVRLVDDGGEPRIERMFGAGARTGNL